MKLPSLIVIAATLFATTSVVHAQESGHWQVRLGAHSVQPKSNNNALVNVDSATSLTFSGTYTFTNNWGIELLAALPFEHDVNLNGGSKVASVKHLPPTLSAQYHFNPAGRVRPYLGAGVIGVGVTDACIDKPN